MPVVNDADGASIPMAPEKFLVNFCVHEALNRVMEGYPLGPSMSIVKG